MPLPKVLPRVHGSQAEAQGQKAGGGGLRAAAAGNGGGRGRGKVVANRYCVEKKLGGGAFGTAFLVTDKRANNDW